MLASDLVALAVAIIGLGIACLVSNRVRRVVFDLAKGPWYVPSVPHSPVLQAASPRPTLTASLWATSLRTVSAVATAIVVLQAGASITSIELSINGGSRDTPLPVVVRVQA